MNKRRPEEIKPNHRDKSGMLYSFKIVWLGSAILFLLIGLWMIYNHEFSSGYIGGRRFGRTDGQPGYTDGYGVLALATFLGITGIAMFWPRKKQKRHAGD